MKIIFRFSVLLTLLFCATVVRAQTQNCAYAVATHQTPDNVTYSPDGVYIVSQTVTYSVQCTNSGNGSKIGPPQLNDVTATGDYDYHVRVRCDPQFTTRNYSSTQWVDATFDNIGQSRYYNAPQSQCENNGPQADTQTVCQPQACPGNCPQCPRQKVCTSGCSSPIILDVTGEGFFLTNAENGVKFDLMGEGTVHQTGWTAKGANNAFLALPGADGLVHDGRQLFGNFTSQPSSSTPNGFAALAVYDQPANGGNGDGIIDARDAIFSSLRLWIDANHDGVSQPDELFTLPSLGINSISLNYKLDERRDQYGNLFSYRAQVNAGTSAAGTGRMAYDVFLIQGGSTITARSCPAVPQILPEKDGRLK